MKILVLNFGGTSAKIALYEDEMCKFSHTFHYSEREMDKTLTGKEHLEIKLGYVREWLNSIGVDPKDIDAYGVRLGGMFYGGEGGTFRIEGDLRKQVDKSFHLDKPLAHPTRVTMELVDKLREGRQTPAPAFATDPASIDQYLPESRLTGCQLFNRRNSFHALSQRAVAKLAAKDIGKTYETANIIVAHAGGGISVGAHEKGRVIDVNDSTGLGDGSFSTDRAGTIPAGRLLDLAYSGEYTKKELYNLLNGGSGLKGYLGTVDLIEIEKRIANGDEKALLVFKALAYQIAREIGACYATLCGEVDAIVMTAGMANSKMLFEMIKKRVGKMAPMFRYTGDYENDALAGGAYRVLKNLEKEAEYKGEEGHVLAYS